MSPLETRYVLNYVWRILMSKLEVDEENALKAWCEDHGILCIKFTPKGECGWPDRVCILPTGLHVWVEMKRKGETPRRLQLHRIETLHNQRVTACWADSAEKAIAILEGYL